RHLVDSKRLPPQAARRRGGSSRRPLSAPSVQPSVDLGCGGPDSGGRIRIRQLTLPARRSTNNYLCIHRDSFLKVVMLRGRKRWLAHGCFSCLDRLSSEKI